MSFESCVENGHQAKWSQRSSLIIIQESPKTARSRSVHWWPGHQRPVKVGLHCQAVQQGVTTIQYSHFGLNLQLENGGGSRHPCLPLDCSRGYSPITHANILRVNEFATNSEKWNGNGMHMCQRSTPTLELLRVYGLDMPEWREMTEQIDWRAKQPPQVACVSKDLNCWGAWDNTCGHKAKDITPSIAWRREAWKEDALERTRELGHHQSDEHWNHFKGNVEKTSERPDRAHIGFSNA